MREAAFEKWLLTIGRLDAPQRERALRALALAGTGVAGETAPVDVGEGRLRDGSAPAAAMSSAQGDGGSCDDSLLAQIGRGRIESFGCPHCRCAEVRSWGRAGGKPRYRCAACRRTFNPLTGTALAGLHYPERWRDQAQAFLSTVKGYVQLGGALSEDSPGIAMKSMWLAK